MPFEGVSVRMRHNGDATVPFYRQQGELSVIGLVLPGVCTGGEGTSSGRDKEAS